MVRFNLYKACFEQLHMGFVKLIRLIDGLRLDSYETDTLKDATKDAFDQFKVYCRHAMLLRRKEVLVQRRKIDSTTWEPESVN